MLIRKSKERECSITSSVFAAIKMRDVFRFTSVILIIIFTYESLFSTFLAQETEDKHLVLAESAFHNFNNVNGNSKNIVPNIIHFLRFDQQEMEFTDAICILAALRNHNPDQIYIHSDSPYFTGKYWKYLLNIPEFLNKYQIIPIIVPSTIFDQEFEGAFVLEHASDVTRIRILMQYGGIFLENDSYVVKNLTKYLKYEMSVSWDEDDFLASQILIAHPDARFLKLWLESYRDNYDSIDWYFNSAELPTISILDRFPGLVHRVEKKFGFDAVINENLYSDTSENWREYEVIHLMINSRQYVDKYNYDEYPIFTDENVLECNFSFCLMAREAYFGRL